MRKLKIRECSDLDYEGMVVDICCDSGRIAVLSCDEGIDKAKIKIFDGLHEKPSWELDYFDFVRTLNKSIDILKEINDHKNS